VEFGERVLARVAEILKDISSIEMKPTLEGRSMNMVLAPK
jgi:translation initiation factor IF-3